MLWNISSDLIATISKPPNIKVNKILESKILANFYNIYAWFYPSAAINVSLPRNDCNGLMSCHPFPGTLALNSIGKLTTPVSPLNSLLAWKSVPCCCESCHCVILRLKLLLILKMSRWAQIQNKPTLFRADRVERRSTPLRVVRIWVYTNLQEFVEIDLFLYLSTYFAHHNDSKFHWILVYLILWRL